MVLQILSTASYIVIPANAESPNGSLFDKFTSIRIFVLRGSTESGNFGGLLQSIISKL